jgi:hypothetical protein
VYPAATFDMVRGGLSTHLDTLRSPPYWMPPPSGGGGFGG